MLGGQGRHPQLRPQLQAGTTTTTNNNNTNYYYNQYH